MRNGWVGYALPLLVVVLLVGCEFDSAIPQDRGVQSIVRPTASLPPENDAATDGGHQVVTVTSSDRDSGSSASPTIPTAGEAEDERGAGEIEGVEEAPAPLQQGESESGTAGDGGAVGAPIAPQEGEPVSWQSYQNEAFHFRIDHPEYYEVRVTEPTNQGVPLAEIQFRDRRVEDGAAGARPAEFTIRLFENEQSLPLEEWLRVNRLIPPEARWQLEPYSLAGMEGLRAYREEFVAPGWHIYLARGNYVYQLTPLGEEANRMLPTFSFTD